MTLYELVVAYIQYPAIIAYMLIAAISLGVYFWNPAPLAPTLITIGVATLVYPLVGSIHIGLQTAFARNCPGKSEV